MLSIIVTNIFKNPKGIEILFKCLGNQTIKDFELVIVDIYYPLNKKIVYDLSEKYKIKKVLHTPGCQDTHVPHIFHWELYNNALMLCSNELFFRMGIYRWYMPNAIESILDNYENGYYSYYFNHRFNELELSFFDEKEQIINNYFSENFHEEPLIKNYASGGHGMFSFSKEEMIKINGNNEGFLGEQPEDHDISNRLRNKIYDGKFKSIEMTNGCYRIKHNKEYNNIKNCFYGYNNGFQCQFSKCLLKKYVLNENIDNFKYFHHDNYQWQYCTKCNFITMENIKDYLDHLLICDNPIAPIGLNGTLGRNLQRLNEDITKKKNLFDKILLISSSHDNKRYLEV